MTYPTYYANKCFVLIGPPASGKSTWRVNNIRATFLTPDTPEPDAVVISGDDLIEEECQRTGETYSEVFQRHDFKEQKRILRERFTAAISDARDIVIDRTNLTIKGRRSFLASLPKSYERVAVVFKVEQAELFRRLDERAAATGKYIPHKVVNDMIESYEPPSDGEFHRIIHR